MAVPARINLVTLAVTDLSRARAFYAALGWQPSGPEGPGAEEVAFYDLNGVVFALYRRDYMLRDLGIAPEVAERPRSTPPEMTLAINVETAEDVSSMLAEAEAAGATILAPAARMDWGGTAGYFADPDGHAWEVAHNPMMPLGPDGRMQLP
jgi:uncharacterized protein